MRELLKGENRIFVNGKTVDIEKKVLNLIFPDAYLDIKYENVLNEIISDFKDQCDIIFTVIP